MSDELPAIHTSDINFSAYLSVKGAKLTEVFYHGSKCTWVFSPPGWTRDPYVDFLNGDTVSAIKFAEALRSAKHVAVANRKNSRWS